MRQIRNPKYPKSQIPSALLLTSTMALAAPNVDWTGWRGPGAMAVSDSRQVPLTWSADQNVAWQTELPGAGGSSPIVAGQHIYLTCYTGYAVPGEPQGDLSNLKRHLLCLNRFDGELIWTREVAATLPEQDRVRDHGYASSTPAADADRVCVFFGKSGVFAFSHQGEKLWQADVGSGIHGWGSAASPVFHKNLVIINACVESESLIALDRTTGQEVWRAQGMKESWNTPLLVSLDGDRTELVVATFGKVLGFNPDSGEALWSCDTGIGWYMVPSLVNHREVVYCIGGRTGGALAVRAGGRGDVTESHRVWTLKKGSNVSSPVFHQGHLYWAHEQLGIINCVQAERGELLYEERLPRAGQFYASPVLAGGKLYFVSRDGSVFVIEASPQFKQLAKNNLADRSRFDASPVVDGDRLLLRSDRFLHCIATRAP